MLAVTNRVPHNTTLFVLLTRSTQQVQSRTGAPKYFHNFNNKSYSTRTCDGFEAYRWSGLAHGSCLLGSAVHLCIAHSPTRPVKDRKVPLSAALQGGREFNH